MEGLPSSDWTPSSDEVYVSPVEEEGGMTSPSGWQLLSVSLHRSPQLGFGIAISGGIDNPLFTSGEGTVVISDVVLNGPASGLLQLNDRILSANGISFESIPYARAVEVIKHSSHINMIVKRRVPVPVMEFEQRTLKFTLTKSRKKDDFGIVLGCKYYIKEIKNPKLAEKEPGLRVGDTVLRVNGQSLDGVGVDEAGKWLERSREKLCLVIQRDVRQGATRWPSTQTVYERLGSVAATPRHSPSPLMHMPLSARSSHEYINNGSYKGDLEGVIGREGRDQSRDGMGGEMRGRMASASPMMGSQHGGGGGLYDYHFPNPSSRPDERGQRTVCFHKVGGSVGIRVVGGNEVGIFVSAVAAESPAARHGVCPGDRILEVNGRSMNGITRESAVKILMGLEERVILRLEYASSHLEYVRQSQIGDNFFVRAHFDKKGGGLELGVSEGDIFHVTDTLFGGTVGVWQASRVYSSSGKADNSKGVIPNLETAEGLLRETRRAMEERESKGRGTLLRRKLESRRTKSLPKNVLGGENQWMGMHAYERVVLNTPTFPRPVILVGPLADVARRLLLSQFALLFAAPQGEGVIRLPAVDAVISSGKHCILDITIDSVERLQLAQYAPIVILIDVESRSRLREIRKKMEAPRISSKLLAEQAGAIKKNHSHLLSATVDASQEEGWLEAVRDLIGHLQMRRLWMPEMPCTLPLEDILLFTNGRMEKDEGEERDRSVNQDYGEYSLSEDVNKSLYQWQSAGHTSLRVPSSNGSESGWGSMKRGERERKDDDISVASSVNRGQTTSMGGWTEYGRREEERRMSGGGREERMREEERRMEEEKRKGYYNMQQLLKGDEVPEERREGEEEKKSELKWRMKERREPVKSEAPYPPSDCSPPIPTSSSGVSSEGREERGERPAIPPKTFLRERENNNGAERSREAELRNTPTNGFERAREAEMRSTPTTAYERTRDPEMRSTPNGTAPRKDSKEEDPSSDSHVLEETRGWMGAEGGILSCPASNVHLIIPPGAIKSGEKQEIYMKVCEDERDSSAVDASKGEEVLSPLVICGPHGLVFDVPLELRLPHGVKEDKGSDWKFSLKTGEGDEWRQMDVNPKGDNQFIALQINQF